MTSPTLQAEQIPPTINEQSDNAIKWILALFSGKYQQCQESLFKFTDNGDPSYCCLGVAEKILGNDPRKMKIEGLAWLTPKSQALLGLVNDRGVDCDGLNDTEELNFKQIAIHLLNNEYHWSLHELWMLIREKASKNKQLAKYI